MAVLLFVMAAQLLIPLLHGHFGTPKQAGLHVHAAPSWLTDAQFHAPAPQAAALVEHDHEGLRNAEPFEVDVQTALQPLDFMPAPPMAAVGLALLTFGLLAARMRCIAPRPAPRSARVRPPARWRGRVIRPSPAQAPPLNS